MRSRLIATLVATMLCAACGGGDGNANPTPSDPCLDLGYGEPAAGLVGEWERSFYNSTDSFTLHDNGTFVDHSNGGRYAGFWGLAADGTFTAKYSLTTECPPIGTLMTAAGVTADDTRIGGRIISSPVAGLTGTNWGIERADAAQ